MHRAAQERQTKAQAMRWLDGATLWAGVPALLLIATLSAGRSGMSGWLVAYASTALGALLLPTLGARLPTRIRAWAYVELLLVIAFTSIAIHGTLPGTGVIFTGAVMIAAVLLDRRAIWIAVGQIPVLLTASALLVPSALAATDWLRIGITSLTIIVPLGLMLNLLIHQLELSRQQTIQALEDAQAAHHGRRRLSEELNRALRLESLGRLAGGVAHDVNNALSVVMSNGELLAEGYGSAEERAEMLADVLHAAHSAREVIDQLMLLGRARGHGEGPTDVSATLQPITRALRRLLPESIDLDVRLETEAWAAVAPSTLDHILLNLTLNARDAMPEGGRLSVSATAHEGWVAIAVGDTGQGMSEDVKARLFEPFFTTKKEGRGTGLGLTSVYSKVHEAGGTLSVESREGEGSVFTLRLPAVPPPEQTAPEGMIPGPLRPLVVLLVEDDDRVRAGMARMLDRDRHQVSQAHDERSARARLVEGARFDLLLTDAVMPDSDTAAMIDAFHSAFPSAPVLVCSGWSEKSHERVTQLGIEHLYLLQKPLTPTGLRAAIARAVRRADQATQAH
ncbi:MAG: response regulator [Deltaproteobacteria bacterium]|nr:response regulator [Deltaproteobacteria bacterium]